MLRLMTMIAVLLFVAHPSTSLGADVLWINPTGGGWGNPTNWSTGVAPGDNDTAIFNALSGPYIVTIAAARTVGSVAINADDCTLSISGASSDASLTVANGFINHGTIELSSSSTVRAATLAVTTGTLTNAAGATIHVLPGTGGNRNLTFELNNQGTINCDTACSIGGTLSQHQNAGSIHFASNPGASYVFGYSLSNAGQITSETTVYLNVNLINSGSISFSGSISIGRNQQGMSENRPGATLSIHETANAVGFGIVGPLNNGGLIELTGISQVNGNTQGRLTNTAGGEIHVLQAVHTPTIFFGYLDNFGRITIARGMQVQLIVVLAQNDASVINFEIAGTGNSDVAHVLLGLAAPLSPGRIGLSLVGGFVPAIGQQFNIINSVGMLVDHLSCSDIDGLLFGNGLRFNLVRTSNSLSLSVVNAPVQIGDLNCDCSVGLADLATLLANFGSTNAGPSQGDVNNDHRVSLDDLAILLGQFGTTCP